MEEAGFSEKEYRGVEVWKGSKRNLAVGLLEQSGMIAFSRPGDGGVRDVIRTQITGSGFLLEANPGAAFLSKGRRIGDKWSARPMLCSQAARL